MLQKYTVDTEQVRYTSNDKTDNKKQRKEQNRNQKSKRAKGRTEVQRAKEQKSRGAGQIPKEPKRKKTEQTKRAKEQNRHQKSKRGEQTPTERTAKVFSAGRAFHPSDLLVQVFDPPATGKLFGWILSEIFKTLLLSSMAWNFLNCNALPTG